LGAENAMKPQPSGVAQGYVHAHVYTCA